MMDAEFIENTEEPKKLVYICSSNHFVDETEEPQGLEINQDAFEKWLEGATFIAPVKEELNNSSQRVKLVEVALNRFEKNFLQAAE